MDHVSRAPEAAQALKEASQAVKEFQELGDAWGRLGKGFLSSG